MIHCSDSFHAFMATYNTCIHACLGASVWFSGAVWLMTVAAQSPRAAPCCSSPPWCVPISPVLLQAGHPLPCSNIPNFSSRSLPDSRMQTAGNLGRLNFSQSMCSTAYWFFFPLTLSLLYPMALCQIVSLGEKNVKLVVFIAWISIVSILLSLLYCSSHSHKEAWMVYHSESTFKYQFWCQLNSVNTVISLCWPFPHRSIKLMPCLHNDRLLQFSTQTCYL